jgi:hypothetical protein
VAGPWEKYGGTTQSGPWAKYAKPSRKARGGDVLGAAANLYQSIPLMDEGAAALDTGLRMVRGQAKTIPEAWRQSREMQGDAAQDFQARRPTTTAVIRGGGTGASVFVPAGASANLLAQGSRVGNALRGATVAGANAYAYGAADGGSLEERAAAGSRAASNPLVLGLGAAGGSLASGARGAKPRKAAPARTDGDILAEVGVSTTVPQRMGRAAKGAEDLMRRAPITGQAMAGYQERQLGQLNRAVGLKALQPVGKAIPKEVKPGFEMVEYVDDELGKVYGEAADMVPRVQVDEELATSIGQIAARRADLAESEARQFDSIIKDRLTRLSGGEASGRMVKEIFSELGTLQREQARKGNNTLASMLGDTRQAVMGLIARANPQAGDMIRRADEGWRIYSMMNDAAAAASARGGVFLPGQLNTQVRSAAKGMGSNMAGKGKGPLQDIATAASRTIPDSYGNPGTSNALGAGAAGVGILTEPATTLTVGTALTAAATPYFLAGRKVLESLPANASVPHMRSALQRLTALAAKDPSVEPLRRQVAEALEKAARVAGAQAGTARGAPASTEPGAYN